MKIGIDARCLCGPTSGIGRYLLEIIHQINRIDSSIEFNLYSAPNKPIQQGIFGYSVRSINLPRQVALKFTFDFYAKLDQIDIFWATQTLLPGFRRAKYKTISTVHDLNHVLVPETMSPVTRLSHRYFFESDARRADAIVCNSHGTAARLKNLIGIECENVAQPGVSEIFNPSDQGMISDLKQRLSINKPYFLSLSTAEPRKNIPLLLDTYIDIYEENPSTTPLMLLAGPKGWQDNSRYMSHPGIRHLGYLEYSDLPALYSGAEAFIFPSIYEGFGMPAAEASACGTKVIATDIPELREAAGPNAIYINPCKKSLKDAIQNLNPGKQQPFIASNWEDSARTYIKVFNSLVGN